jgi:methylase of polypeptide subunit release factors
VTPNSPLPSRVRPLRPEDPLLAIDGGSTGLDVAQACLAVAARNVAPGSSVLLQLGYDDQADALAPVAAARGLVERERRHGERGLVVRYDRLGPAPA